ncbi:MAG: methyltransferase domain-containing protein [Polyangiaceae bacterium]|nr:methyltransferase domain-containing protein [Polyangiaceae bacterium]
MSPSPAAVLARVAGALPPVERAYARARFLALRPQLLGVMDELLPTEGPLLDLGCGFGLWSAYFGAMRPGRRLHGVDLSPRRIELAGRVAAALGVRATFAVGDARTVALGEGYVGAYMLDVLHPLPRDAQRPLLERVVAALRPGGVLVVKEITTEPRAGLWFTRALDRAMVGLDAPLAYRHHDEWRALLGELGLRAEITRVRDVLPFPHVVLTSRVP